MKIYLFEPSSPSDPDTLGRSLELFKREFSFLCKDFLLCKAGQIGKANPDLPYIASTDEIKADAFSRLIRKKEDFSIWFTRGGYGISRWLSHVDFDSLRNHLKKKLLMGFSDTTFLASILLKLGMPFLHCPMPSTLYKTEHKSRQAFYQFLNLGIVPRLSGLGLHTGICQGTLIGGNLTCLCHSIGTPGEPNWHDTILFLEDCGEDIYRIDRMLTQLIECGILDKVKGIALGSFLLGSNKESSSKLLTALFKDRLLPLAKPLVAKLPIGHGRANMPILLGTTYEIDGQKGTLTPIFQPLRKRR